METAVNIYEHHDALIECHYRQQKDLKRREQLIWWTLAIATTVGLIGFGIIGTLIGAWFGKG